jgi:uncharacterized protein YndB with AHSA1/START domain
MSAHQSLVEYPSDREMVFTRTVAAPRELVWTAWTDPEQVILWWGPKGFTNTTHQMEVKPGGTWRFTMHGPDGTDWPNLITYHVVQAPARLEYDHGDDAKPKWFHVVVDFVAEGAQTKIVTHMAFERAEDCENAKKYGIEGHKTSMERLDAHLPGMAANAGREIVLSRVFAAPRALVWQALTDPKHVMHWWGPRGFSTSTDQMDFRVGGSWVHTMIGPDGTKYPNKSVYKEIVPLERIVYSHGGGREDGRGVNFVSTWLLEDVGQNRTRLTIRHVFPSAEMREHVVREYGAVEGGRQTLARLAEHLPAMQGAPFVITREFNAPRDLVWKAWTERDLLMQWFGPKGFTMNAAQLDLRPGGMFHYRQQMPDGKEMWGRFVYRQITPPSRLIWINSFSDPAGGITRHPLSKDPWPLQLLTDVSFVENAGKTTVTVTWLPFEASAVEWQTFEAGRESMKMGWGGTMERFTAYLAKIASPASP